MKKLISWILAFIMVLLLIPSINATASAAERTVLWKDNFGGRDTDWFNAATAVSDGIVAVGWVWADSFDNGDWKGTTRSEYTNDTYAFIVKYDNEGNILWKNKFGGGGDHFHSITAVADGVIAVGEAYPSSFGKGDWEGVAGKGTVCSASTDAIIVKYDNNGNIVWKKNFGGAAMDEFASVTTVSDGIIAVGSSRVDSFGSGDWLGFPSHKHCFWDATIVKFDFNGNVIWKKRFGGAGADVRDFFHSVAAVSDGIIAVGSADCYGFGYGDWVGFEGKGSETGLFDTYDAIIVKFDFDGNIVWKKNFGGRDMDEFFSVTAVPDGVVAVGSSGYGSFGNGDWVGVKSIAGEYGDYFWSFTDAIIVKYDSNGNVVWKKNFGEHSTASYNSVVGMPGGVIAVGRMNSDAFDSGKALIIEYDHNGNEIWINTFGGGADDYTSVVMTPYGAVAVGRSWADAFGNNDWADVAGKGGTDAVVVKYGVELPSSWALDPITSAIALNIVPSALQSNYTQATTRAEFCSLAVALYETVTGVEIDERVRFIDTSDVNVEKMAAIGVVNGTGDNRFSPNASLTREQAATMISRLADAIGATLASQGPTFNDNANISNWAFDAVGQVQTSGIMGGIGDNMFSPLTDYTREQSIMTMMRLYDNMS